MTEQKDGRSPPPPGTRLARAIADAVVFADSHGDVEQALAILSRAIRLAGPGEEQKTLDEANAFLAELTERSEGS